MAKYITCERELFKRAITALIETRVTDISTKHQSLIDEIEELLAQPEQEPVAWMYDWNTIEEEEYGKTNYDCLAKLNSIPQSRAITNVRPLYTAPQKCEGITPRQGLEEYKKGYTKAKQDLKREPLSDEAICEILLKKEWKRGFVEFARAIEKAHGIGE